MGKSSRSKKQKPRKKRCGAKTKSTRAGRPTKLSKKIQDNLVGALQRGNYITVACAFVGIHKDTFYEWLRRGERAGTRDAKFSDFSDAVKKAQAQAEVRDLAAIDEAAKHPSSWQAAAWKLERKYPDRWGRKERHEVVGKDGAAVKLDVEVTFVRPKKDTTKSS